IQSICSGLREVAGLPEPIGRVLDSQVRPNGLQVTKVSVPLGVILFIFEARPNVTVDAAAFCVKSGKALIGRGGREARHSNAAMDRVLQESLVDCGLPAMALQMVATEDRAAISHLLRLSSYIDLAIPRGGPGLIQRVVEEARMAVLKHYLGNC